MSDVVYRLSHAQRLNGDGAAALPRSSRERSFKKTAHGTRRSPTPARRTALQTRTFPRKPRQDTSDNNCSGAPPNTSHAAQLQSTDAVGLYSKRLPSAAFSSGARNCAVVCGRDSPQAQLDGVADRSGASVAKFRPIFLGTTTRTGTELDVVAVPSEWLLPPGVLVQPGSLFWETELHDFVKDCFRTPD